MYTDQSNASTLKKHQLSSKFYPYPQVNIKNLAAVLSKAPIKFYHVF